MKKLVLVCAVAVCSSMYANDCSVERDLVEQLMAKYGNNCNKEYIYLKEQQANQQAELEYKQAQESLSYGYNKSYDAILNTPQFETSLESELDRNRKLYNLNRNTTKEVTSNIIDIRLQKEKNAMATRQALERCELLNSQIKQAKYNLKICQKKK